MASTYLTRTASGGSNQIYTASCWVKRTKLGTTTSVLTTGNGGADSNARMLIFDATDKIEIAYYNAGFTYQVTTNRLFRDTSAWYHLVVAVDTTQATASDRIKIYVNGVQETSFATSSYPSLNATFNYNSSAQYIGDLRGSGIYGEFLLSHFNYIDGTAYDASAFGETNAASGIWTPLASPSVTYGTNGFFLKFGSSGALGTDSSGNSNTFTVNGSGTQTQDAPSNVFVTMNPLYRTTSINFSNGNNTITSSSGSWNGPASTLAASTGKWYVEGKATGYNHNAVGVASNPNDNSAGYPFGIAGGYGYKLYTGGTTTLGADDVPYGDTLANGDIFQIALDLDNQKIYFGKNGTWQNSGVPTSGATGTGAAFTLPSNETYHFVNALNLQTGGASSQWNFGNGFFGTTAVASGNADGAGYGIFEYAPPTGYYSLCTKNINTYG